MLTSVSKTGAYTKKACYFFDGENWRFGRVVDERYGKIRVQPYDQNRRLTLIPEHVRVASRVEIV